MTLRNGSNLSFALDEDPGRDVVLVATDAAARDRARASSRVGAHLARPKRRGDTLTIDDDLEVASFCSVESMIRLVLRTRS